MTMTIGRFIFSDQLKAKGFEDTGITFGIILKKFQAGKNYLLLEDCGDGMFIIHAKGTEDENCQIDFSTKMKFLRRWKGRR